MPCRRHFHASLRLFSLRLLLLFMMLFLVFMRHVVAACHERTHDARRLRHAVLVSRLR